MAGKAFIDIPCCPSCWARRKPHRLLVSSPCYAKDAEAIEPEFKRLMFSGVV